MNQFPPFRGCSRLTIEASCSSAAQTTKCASLGGDDIKLGPRVKRVGSGYSTLTCGSKYDQKIFLRFFILFHRDFFNSALWGRKLKTELKKDQIIRISEQFEFLLQTKMTS